MAVGCGDSVYIYITLTVAKDEVISTSIQLESFQKYKHGNVQ